MTAREFADVKLEPLGSASLHRLDHTAKSHIADDLFQTDRLQFVYGSLFSSR